MSPRWLPLSLWLVGSVFLAASSGVCDLLPYCGDKQVTEEQLTAATVEVMSKGEYPDALGDQFGAVMEAVEKKLGCRLTKPEAPPAAP